MIPKENVKSRNTLTNANATKQLPVRGCFQGLFLTYMIWTRYGLDVVHTMQMTRKRPGKRLGKRGRENYTECDRATACPRLFQGRVQSVHNQTSMRRTALDTHLSCAA